MSNQNVLSEAFGKMTMEEIEDFEDFLDQELAEPQEKVDFLVVTGYGDKVTEKDFAEFFSVIGPLFHCELCTDEKGKSLGYGYIAYEDPEHTEHAYNLLQGELIQGSDTPITLEYFEEGYGDEAWDYVDFEDQ